jgi:hypothetical protein
MSVTRFERRLFLAGAAGLLAAAKSTPGSQQQVPSSLSGDLTPPLSPEDRAVFEGALRVPARAVEDEKVLVIPIPRRDLAVSLRGSPLPTSFGLTGWVALRHTRDGAATVLMSDVPVLESEANGIISAALSSGLGVSALHNHFFYEEPRLFFLHLHGRGTTAELAAAYARLLADSKAAPWQQPEAPTPTPGRLDAARLAAIIGVDPAAQGEVVKFVVGRPDLTIEAMGAIITKSLGLNSWAALHGESDAAWIAGDIVMLEDEVDGVERALRDRGVEIVALHHHMLGETPRTLFLHYLQRGAAADLASAFRAAIDQTGRRSSGHPHSLGAHRA